MRGSIQRDHFDVHCQAAQRAGHAVIGTAGDDPPIAGNTPGEIAEALDDLVDVAVVIEMIRLNVGDESDLRPEVVEAPVVFARLGDERLATAGMAPAAQLRDGPADDEARIGPALRPKAKLIIAARWSIFREFPRRRPRTARP